MNDCFNYIILEKRQLGYTKHNPTYIVKSLKGE